MRWLVILHFFSLTNSEISALEITMKLCNPEFSRKAKAADFFGHTWDLFLDAGAGKGHDKVLASAQLPSFTEN